MHREGGSGMITISVQGYDLDRAYYYTLNGGMWRVATVTCKTDTPTIARMHTPFGLMRCDDAAVRMIGPVPPPVDSFSGQMVA